MRTVLSDQRQINVILYCKVSSDEQKDGSSLEVQEKVMRAYCANHGYYIIDVYHEDHSAKSYELDRPVLAKVYAYCIKNHSVVDKLLFLRWDRFTRNLEFALTYKRKFYDELGVEINATESTIDFDGAEWSTLLGIYCGVAHTEDIKISKRTKDGIHGTLMKGKWASKAPIGYVNVRRGKHDTEVQVDPERSILVKKAFEEVAKGEEQYICIKRRLFPKMAKTSFTRMLKNRFYIGLIHVPAYRDGPECEVKGVHEPIIDEDTFNQVQAVLECRTPRIPKKKDRIQHPDFYLRGFLLCPVCGYGITSSFSKGKTGRKYGYYHCGHEQRHIRVTAEVLNEKFLRFIQGVKPEERMVDAIGDAIYEIWKQEQGVISAQIDETEKKILNYVKRIKLAEDKYIEGEITKELFDNLNFRYKEEKAALENQLELYKTTGKTKFKEKLDYALSLINHLDDHVFDCPLELKKKVIITFFPKKIIFQGEFFRAEEINSVLSSIALIYKNIKAENKEKWLSIKYLTTRVPQVGLEPTRHC